MKLLHRLFVIATLALLLGGQAVGAQSAGQTWRINLKEADIREMISQIAAITGKTFVVDPRVRNVKVTVISQAELDRAGVYELFLSVLRVNGFAAIPAGDVIKIQQQSMVKQSGSGPFVPGQVEAFVTRVIAAQNVDSNELVKILRPLVAQYGHLAAISTPNVVIISDHAENIDRLMALIERIDVAESDELEVVPLKEAYVGNIVTMLERLAPDQVGANAKGPQRVQAIADERTNSLLLRGKPRPVQQVRSLVARLDTPATAGGTTEVIYLSHASAKETAEILKSLTSGNGNASSLGGITQTSTNSGGGNSTSGSAPTATPRAASNIQADESLNAIVVRGDPSQIQEIRDIVAKLDVRRTQVLIEAAIVEISLADTETIGVDFAAVDARGNSLPFISTALSTSIADVFKALQTTSGAPNPIGAVGAVSKPTVAVAKIDTSNISFGAIIQALASSTQANLLSTPSIMTLDNEEAKITVGQNVPFRTGSFTTDTSGGNNPFTTIQRQDVGVTLKVTPHIHDGTVVRLEVEQEVSSVVPTDTQASAAFSDIVTNKRTIETTILADDGQTIVLGGLIQDDVTSIERRVPLLGEIPYLGQLFSNNDDRRTKRNLLVFLRPTVLRDGQEVARLTDGKHETLMRQAETETPAPTRRELYEGRQLPDRPLQEAPRETEAETN